MGEELVRPVVAVEWGKYIKQLPLALSKGRGCQFPQHPPLIVLMAWQWRFLRLTRQLHRQTGGATLQLAVMQQEGSGQGGGEGEGSAAAGLAEGRDGATLVVVFGEA